MILITGASRGIGNYLLRHYLEQGEEVAGTWLHTPPEEGLKKYYHQVDVTRTSNIQAFLAGLEGRLQKLLLINCAGVNYNSFAHKADPSAWAAVIQTNLIGTFQMIAAILPLMREEGYGRIINMSSVVAQKAIPGTSAYAASKAGMWGMTRSIAIENANKGITINNLNLGYFDIGMIAEVPEAYQETIKKGIPTGAYGDPQNIIAAVDFLRRADYVNGSSLDMNAGIF